MRLWVARDEDGWIYLYTKNHIEIIKWEFLKVLI